MNTSSSQPCQKGMFSLAITSLSLVASLPNKERSTTTGLSEIRRRLPRMVPKASIPWESPLALKKSQRQYSTKVILNISRRRRDWRKSWEENYHKNNEVSREALCFGKDQQAYATSGVLSLRSAGLAPCLCLIPLLSLQENVHVSHSDRSEVR